MILVVYTGVFFCCFVRIFETILCSFSSLSLEELHHIIWSWYSNLSISVLSLGHRRSPSESELKSRHWIHRFGTEGGSISCSVAVPGIAIRTVPQRQLLTVDGWNPALVGYPPWCTGLHIYLLYTIYTYMSQVVISATMNFVVLIPGHTRSWNRDNCSSALWLVLV